LLQPVLPAVWLLEVLVMQRFLSSLARSAARARQRLIAAKLLAIAAKLLAIGLLSLPATAFAIGQQATGTVDLRVVDAETRQIVRLSVAHVRGDVRATVSGGEGRFRLANLPPGTYEVHVAAVNYEETVEIVEVRAGESTELTVELQFVAYGGPQIVVQATRPDLLPDAQLTEDLLREENPRDVGELLRKLPGVDSSRRGPLGFDPVVRGMRETEVGVYLDGSRIFPAGPARMDSALSHFDPGSVQSVEVVGGPYALTWGAGNLTAIRATTQDVPPQRGGYAHGDLRFGFDSNMDAVETVATASGRANAFSYWGYGVYRQGDDYEDGDGNLVPADFQSREVRGKAGYRLAPGSDLTLSTGYQQQRDIDYPGRLLDAESFDALHLMGDWSYYGTARSLRSANVNLYYNDVDHRMNNDRKPTALPMPGRVPPFPLTIVVDTGTRVAGGRAAAEAEVSNSVTAEIGADFYRSNRNAVRTIDRRDNGAPIATDNPWPDVDIDDYGLFGRLESALAAVTLSGTVRVDMVRAAAAEALVSDFFLENTEGPLDADETNVSAAATVSAPLGPAWVVSGGLGSAVRTADALERYSDRFPASKAQFAAEFMGDPQIAPERSTQLDLWIDGRYPSTSVSLSSYYRRIADYITIEATDLPPKLPLSPPTVYRYINGDATFWGIDYRFSLTPADGLTIFLRGDYTWGQDDTLDEPALGVSPLRTSIGAGYAFGDNDNYDVEGTVNLVGEQDRVAMTRGETPTDGYTTLDVRAGARVRGFNIRAGILNVTDEFYVNHLNAKNPFTGRPIAEPGRVLFAKLSYSF
jgi:iron complex outermembrane receptor protein